MKALAEPGTQAGSTETWRNCQPYFLNCPSHLQSISVLRFSRGSVCRVPMLGGTSLASLNISPFTTITGLNSPC